MPRRARSYAAVAAAEDFAMPCSAGARASEKDAASDLPSTGRIERGGGGSVISHSRLGERRSFGDGTAPAWGRERSWTSDEREG